MCHVIIYCYRKLEKTKSTTEVKLEKLNSRSIYEGAGFVYSFFVCFITKLALRHKNVIQYIFMYTV